MQDQHLRPVPPVDPDAEADQGANANGSSPAEGKSPTLKRPRASKALPTDRLKFEAQLSALRALSVASENGKRPVTNADMAARMDVVATTAGLNNAFFVESGLATREGRGKHKPTPETNEFARTFGFDERRAGRALRGPLTDSWYFKAVRAQIEGMGPATREALIELLCHEAEATPDHQVQLGSLLAWLEYAELIVIDGGLYKVAADLGKTLAEVEAEAKGKADEEPDPEKSAPAGESDPVEQEESPPPLGSRREAETVLAFDFAFALTKDDLSKFTPEQIQAIFEAVGKVQAIKAAAES